MDPAPRGGVDPALRVDLQPVRVLGCSDGDDATAMKASLPADVEGQQVVGLPVVGDVQHLLVGRECEAVRLVESVGGDQQAVGARVIAVDEIAELGLGPEALPVPVARVGEPDRAVAPDYDVVGRVQAEAAERPDDRLGGACGAVDARDARGRLERSLLADHERAVAVQKHAVCDVGVVAHGRDSCRVEREAQSVEGEPPDRDAWYAALVTSRHGREVQGVLLRGVHGSLVSLDVDDVGERRRRADDVLEALVVRDEPHAAARAGRKTFGCSNATSARAFGTSVTNASPVCRSRYRSTVWLRTGSQRSRTISPSLFRSASSRSAMWQWTSGAPVRYS